MTYEEKKKYIRAEREKYDQYVDIEFFIEELEKAWAALEFYANPATHDPKDPSGYRPETTPIFEDDGKRAREALNE